MWVLERVKELEMVNLGVLELEFVVRLRKKPISIIVTYFTTLICCLRTRDNFTRVSTQKRYIFATNYIITESFKNQKNRHIKKIERSDIKLSSCLSFPNAISGRSQSERRWSCGHFLSCFGFGKISSKVHPRNGNTRG